MGRSFISRLIVGRLVVGTLAKAVLAAMAAAVLLITAGGSTQAVGGLTFDGVFCMDVYFDVGTPLGQKGDPPGVEDDRAVKILSRIEPHPTIPNTWNVTSVSYSGPPDAFGIPTEPPSTADCKTKGDGNSLIPAVPFQPIDLGERPTAQATIVVKVSQSNLTWTRCQFEEDLLGGRWVDSTFELVITGKTLTQDFGLLTAKLDPDEAICSGTTSMDTITFVTILASTARVKTKGEPSPSLNDDWDGDGCTDWDELADPPPDGRDPFNPNDCGVGGIAGLPEVAAAPVRAIDSSGGGASLILGVGAAAIISAAALALGGGVWYARKRRT